ncbi:hypothetical protein ACFPZ3_48250, partial [Nonomuraea insulae]
MLQLLSALCAGLSTWLWLSPRTPAERLIQLRQANIPPPSPISPHPKSTHQGLGINPAQFLNETPRHPPWLDPANQHPHRLTRKTALTATGTGLIIGFLIGGSTGMIASLVITPAVALFLHKKEPQPTHHDRRRIATDLPFAADLMTACLRAGRPVSAATEITAGAIGGPEMPAFFRTRTQV